MDHFPIFVRTKGQRIMLAGGGDAALAKLRLLFKSDAQLTVLAADPAPEIEAWAAEGKLTLIRREVAPGDAAGCVLAYAAHEDEVRDDRALHIMSADGALVNVVDDLGRSQFITPAIVDRSPVVVAIGTEGAAPVLARRIKADLESRLSPALGRLTDIARGFRARAEDLRHGAPRRRFWADWFELDGPRASDAGRDLDAALGDLLDRHLAGAPRAGHVDFVGAGPGDPELLTLKARAALDRADVIIHDRLIAPAILELARREATLIAAGKEGFGPSVSQDDINALLIRHARRGQHVVRLKSGDPGVFGRLDEETEALDAAGIGYAVVPGITAASAAAAGLGRSLTRRGRNTELRLLTGHDMAGFTDQDWSALARPGAVAGIYMGKRASRWMQGRMLMHGADPATPVTVVENASRPEARQMGGALSSLPDLVEGLDGPAVILLGIVPRDAADVTARSPFPAQHFPPHEGAPRRESAR